MWHNLKMKTDDKLSEPFSIFTYQGFIQWGDRGEASPTKNINKTS
jgi:hypothetical protein